MSSSTSVWKKTRNSGAPRVVGSFFEFVASQLTGGTPPMDSDEGDLVIDFEFSGEIQTSLLEAKARQNTSSFEIPWDQFRRHGERVKRFPFDGGPVFYLLFSYNSWESRTNGSGPNGERCRLLVQKVEDGKGIEFLSENTLGLWVFPFRALEILKGKKRLLSGKFPAQADTRTLHVEKSLMHELVRNPKGELGRKWSSAEGTVSVNLDTKDLRSVEFQIEQSVPKTCPMSFPVFQLVSDEHPILPLKFVKWEERRR